MDWSQPIEAVHEDGRVVAVELADWQQPDDDGEYILSTRLPWDDAMDVFGNDGKHANPRCPWHIRNRPPEAR